MNKGGEGSKGKRGGGSSSSRTRMGKERRKGGKKILTSANQILGTLGLTTPHSPPLGCYLLSAWNTDFNAISDVCFPRVFLFCL